MSGIMGKYCEISLAQIFTIFKFSEKIFSKKIPKILRKLPRLPKFLLLLDPDKNLLFYNKILLCQIFAGRIET